MIERDYFAELNGQLKSKKINNFIDDATLNIADLYVQLQQKTNQLEKMTEALALQAQIDPSDLFNQEQVVDNVTPYYYFFYNPENSGIDDPTVSNTHSFWSSYSIVQEIIESVNYATKETTKLYKYTADPANSANLTRVDLTDYYDFGMVLIESETPTLKLMLDVSDSYADTFNMLRFCTFPSPGVRPTSVKLFNSDDSTDELLTYSKPRVVVPILREQTDGTYTGTSTKRFLIEVPTVTLNGNYYVGLTNIEVLKNTYSAQSTFNYNVRFYINEAVATPVATAVTSLGLGAVAFTLAETDGTVRWNSQTSSNISFVLPAILGYVDMVLTATLQGSQNTAVFNGIKFTFQT